MKARKTLSVRLAVGALLLGGALTVRADSDTTEMLRDIFDLGMRYTSTVEFLGRAVNANVGCEPNCQEKQDSDGEGWLAFPCCTKCEPNGRKPGRKQGGK